MFLLNETTHRMLIQYHPVIGHLFVPEQVARIPSERGGYYVRTNGQGFRSDLDFRPERGERPRILFFGDSITAGDGCSNRERFAERVGEMLGAEVYNYGLSGSGTDQQLLILEELGRQVEADLIVLSVYVENIERVKAAYRPSVDRVTGRGVLVPKPYFTLRDGELELNHVPVPRERPPGEGAVQGLVDPGAIGRREANPRLKPFFDLVDRLAKNPRFDRLARFLQPRNAHEDFTRVRAALMQLSRYQPHPDYLDLESDGCRLLGAILRRFCDSASPTPVLIVPIPSREFYIDGVKPVYQRFYQSLAAPERGVHVADVTRPLMRLPFEKRKRLRFAYDMHLSPYGNDEIARILAATIRERGLLPAAGSRSAPAPAKPPAEKQHRYVLGISCFYHDSAAALVRDGEIVAATEEERFTRLKNDRRFPRNAVNAVLEAGRIDVSDLSAVVYYDDAYLTFQRLMHTLAEVGEQAPEAWQLMLPSWVTYKLRVPSLIRRYLKYEGPVLQDEHHRSHAASAFLASPYDRAAILTIDGVGEWATASIGVGRGSDVHLLKEMHFPHSLGLLYSAFTQFLGFKVNEGEYKMMGLAPYGEPRYRDLILKELVDLKQDGSLELNLDYFSFLAGESMTNERFADLFGGPARRSDERIGRREMDLARSIQEVTEEAMLRMCREAHRLTGEKRLCMSGGVALNCVANGRILREGPFEDIWIQPAAGDAGSALGAALDVYHGYLGGSRFRREDGRAIQLGSHLGAEYSDGEIQAFLDTNGYPYEKLSPGERAETVARCLADGKVVGHFAGRTEFGPRALGARSILGDPRNRDMQVNLNLKIKYRESFRPFAPAVLEERVSEYFDLDRPAKYMQVVAPVRSDRCLPFDRGEGTDLLEIVRVARSDIPAVTHVDYSARIQTIRREDHPEFYDVVAAFERLTGCGVVVNTSFNVRGEPIVNTPFDAYRCFMRTEMDVLVLGNLLLRKEKQPPWPEPKGDLEGVPVRRPEPDAALLAGLERVYREDFLPLLRRIRGRELPPLCAPFGSAPSLWLDHPEGREGKRLFEIPPELQAGLDPQAMARALVGRWLGDGAPRAFESLVAKLLEVGGRSGVGDELEEVAPETAEEVPETVYAMF
jgi:carbamoyltransferase